MAGWLLDRYGTRRWRTSPGDRIVKIGDRNGDAIDPCILMRGEIRADQSVVVECLDGILVTIRIQNI